MSSITTHSGVQFDLLNPTPDMVHIDDIAHALSYLCRYTGHCNRFYSVAEHSILVSCIVPEELALQALLHDATEAYVNDLARPLKDLLPEYKAIEQRVWVAVADKFGLPHELDERVKYADNVALVSEKTILLDHADWTIPGVDVNAWLTAMLITSVYAKDPEATFLARFKLLKLRKSARE